MNTQKEGETSKRLWLLEDKDLDLGWFNIKSCSGETEEGHKKGKKCKKILTMLI